MPAINIITRRSFLTHGLGAVGIATALPQVLIRTAFAAPKTPANERILVVLQLSGGNDCLSTLVPYGHEAYAKARKLIRIGDDEVLKINNELGLHPQLRGFQELLKQGTFAAVPGVGYPKPNYSHFTSTDIWHMADPRGREVPCGWIGRACDQGFAGNRDPKLALAVGSSKAPPALNGRDHHGLCFSQPDSFRYKGDRGDKSRAELYRKLNQISSGQPQGEIAFVTQTAADANACSEEIRSLASVYKSKIEYPKHSLANNLRTIAALISGGLSTRIYFTFHDGYDTHAGQRKAHDNLMAQLNDAIFAFQQDLAQQGKADRVLMFTTSEFGRRIIENGTEGTDHGAGGTTLLFGPAVKPGICGAHPSLTDLEGGGGGSLKHTVDFRSVYATALEKWLGIPSEPVLGKYPLLDLLA
jgi:uncharacterized protein (DUF1501 family)